MINKNIIMGSRYEKLKQKFHIVLVQFLDEIINITNNQYEDLILARIMIKDQIPVGIMMDEFITHGLPYADKVANKDEKFFLADVNILNRIIKADDSAETKLNLFKTVWSSLGEANKEAVWKYVQILFKIAKLCADIHTNT